ncbi:Glycerol kinase [BD1-7 clade bacterium]|uniref:Glycerol kinase n=1 Tax=BD1-7 clade bacterium TaxID=2029982 RepID=A0A5S9MYS5_9GAMM|nr:Glycerol kinase [BD1-7 clade bacterium]CAA0082793.1 Glycerol kinase [BD1-7 clade bacterium]
MKPNQGMFMETLLVIDQGTHSTRAIVFNQHGHALAQSQYPVVVTTSDEGHVEQEVLATIQSVRECLAHLEKTLSRDTADSLIGIALIAQRSSFVACRPTDMTNLTEVISWQDTRSLPWLVHQPIDGEFIHNMTGLHLSVHYGASKMRWLLDNDAKVQSADDDGDLQFVPLAAFMCQRLTDAPVFLVDRDIAARTLLCRFGGRDWDTELLDVFGLENRQLPDIVDSLHTYGDVSFCGRQVPLIFSGGDQSLLPLAWGEEALHASVMVNVGSGACIQVVERKPRKVADVPEELLHMHLNLRHNGQLEDCLVLEGTLNAAATAVDWLAEQCGHPFSFSDIEDALEHIHNPPVFINRLRGSGSPYWLNAGRPWFEEKETDSLSDTGRLVAVIESIIFLLVDNLVLMQQTKLTVNRIYISGGLSRSHGFCQKLANLSNKTVLRMDDSEACARGAATYVFMRLGIADIDDEEIRRQAGQFFPLLDNGLNARFMRHRQCMEDARQKM